MKAFENIVVGLIVLGAVLYLWKALKPKPQSGGCGCGTVDCKVPKPEINRDQAE